MIGRELVCSAWYGRWRKSKIKLENLFKIWVWINVESWQWTNCLQKGSNYQTFPWVKLEMSRFEVIIWGPSLRPESQYWYPFAQPSNILKATQTAALPSMLQECGIERSSKIWAQGVQISLTLRKRSCASSSWFDRLRISDRKFVNHTTEMILWSMILIWLGLKWGAPESVPDKAWRQICQTRPLTAFLAWNMSLWGA